MRTIGDVTKTGSEETGLQGGVLKGETIEGKAEVFRPLQFVVVS